MDAAHPVIILDGNCHAHHLGAIFTGSGMAETYVVGNDWGFVPSYAGKITTYVTEPEAHAIAQREKAAGRRVFQASQVTQLRGPQTLSYSADVEKIARYPQMEFYACSPDVFAAKFGSKQSLSRILRLDLSTIAQCQKHCGGSVDFVDTIDRLSRSQQLFHCAVHPGGLLTSLLFRCVAEQIGIFEPAKIEAVEADVRSREAINFESDPGYPVAQEILDELGFQWPEWYPDYRTMLLDAKSSRHGAVLARLDHYEKLFRQDTQFWRSGAEAAVAVKDDKLIAKMTEGVTEICPGWAPGWVMRYGLWHRLGDETQMAATLREAAEFHGEHRQLYSFLAGCAHKNGRFDEAIENARRYRAKTFSKPDGAVIVIAFMIWSHRRDDAIREAYRSASEMNAGEREHLSRRLLNHGLDLKLI